MLFWGGHNAWSDHQITTTNKASKNSSTAILSLAHNMVQRKMINDDNIVSI
jgi:hypothetical protein